MNNESLISLSVLFSNRIFRIPDYQRGYSWEEEQCVEFWSDLLNACDSNQKHYTGMLSLKKVKIENTAQWDSYWMTKSGNYTACHIVDGQQRLTTIEILIKVIINFCENNSINILNSEELPKIKEKYLERFVPGSNEELKSFIFGYVVDQESDDYFKYYVMECKDSPKLTESIYTRNMKNAKSFFEEKLKILLGIEDNKKIDIEKCQIIIDKLFEVITTKLMFNVYFVDDNFNVNMAFETMNNRGKKLSNLEILKNRLIYLLNFFPVENQHLLNEARKLINSTWKEIYVQLGSNPEKKLDDEEFLRAHWIIYFGYNRSKSNAYATFLLKEYFVQQNIKGSSNNKIKYFINDQDNYENVDGVLEDNIKYKKIEISDLMKYLNSIKSLAGKWAQIHNPNTIPDNDDEEIKKIKYYLNRINLLGPGYFKPLMLSVYNSDNISNENKIEILKQIERYQFFEFRIFNYNPSYQNSYFYSLAKKIYNNSVDISECLNKLKEIDNMENNVIDSVSIKNFSNRLFKDDGFYGWGTKYYLLYEYEEYLKGNAEYVRLDPKEFFLTEAKKTSIEHIYPQTPTDQSWINAFSQYSNEEKNRLLNTIGNLLPLSLKINSQLQNMPFKSKKESLKAEDGKILRAGYKNGSYNEQEVNDEEQWTSKEILKRGLKIVKFMENYWNFKFKSEEDKKIFLGLEDIDIPE